MIIGDSKGSKAYHLSDESDQDAITIAMNIFIITCFLISKGFITSFFTTMWYPTDGYVNQYCCASYI